MLQKDITPEMFEDDNYEDNFKSLDWIGQIDGSFFNTYRNIAKMWNDYMYKRNKTEFQLDDSADGQTPNIYYLSARDVAIMMAMFYLMKARYTQKDSTLETAINYLRLYSMLL